MSESLYVPLGGGRYRATELTQGPWHPGHQHGSPAAALLAREIRATAGSADMVATRFAVDILGPIPVGEVTVRAQVARPGRRVECLTADMAADGRTVAHARCWRMRRADTSPIAHEPAPARLPRPGRSETRMPLPDFGYFHAIDWRFAEGAVRRPGPAVLWTRLKVPVVPGEEPAPLERLAGVADTASGVSSELDFAAYTFANVDFTLHLVREPAGAWFCLDSVTTIGPGGSGQCRTRLYDDVGDLGNAAQTLFIARRDRTS